MNAKEILQRSEQGFTLKMPDKDGLWQLACDENYNIAECVAVSNKAHTIHTCIGGSMDLKCFHDNIIDPMWKFIA